MGRQYNDLNLSSRVDCQDYAATVAAGATLGINPNGASYDFRFLKVWDEVILDMSGTHFRLQNPLPNRTKFRINLQVECNVTSAIPPSFRVYYAGFSSWHPPLAPAGAGQVGSYVLYWASHVMTSGYDLNNYLDMDLSITNDAAATTALAITWLSVGYELVE